jgi:hypothetical protein
MAEVAEIEWFNPISEKYEWVTGVFCSCYECKNDAIVAGGITAAEGGLYYTKAEYRLHQTERRKAYNAYIEENNRHYEELEAAHTKETEAPGRHGRLPGVPTFFDVKTGGKAYADDLTNPGASWSRLWRASVKKD